jgi:hypothetical protein
MFAKYFRNGAVSGIAGFLFEAGFSPGNNVQPPGDERDIAFFTELPAMFLPAFGARLQPMMEMDRVQRCT